MMLTPDNPLIKPDQSYKKNVLPEAFGILCWNIHKENKKKNFTPLIQEWKDSYSLEFILLQEARFSKNCSSISGFPFVAAANLSFYHYFSGVVTLSHIEPIFSHSQMTRAKEAYVSTRKSALVTVYAFKDQTRLMVVNVHAINFRNLLAYQLELSKLYNRMKMHQGPLIFAGDFNCWTRQRKAILDDFTGSLNLAYIRPRFSGHIKHWFGHRLDRIYFRDLILHDIRALDCQLFSDHNPIIARFGR